MTKLSDVKPGEFFITNSGGRRVFLKVSKDGSVEYRYNKGTPREHLAVNTISFQLTTWLSDGELEVEIVKPEDV